MLGVDFYDPSCDFCYFEAHTTNSERTTIGSSISWSVRLMIMKSLAPAWRFDVGQSGVTTARTMVRQRSSGGSVCKVEQATVYARLSGMSLRLDTGAQGGRCSPTTLL